MKTCFHKKCGVFEACKKVKDFFDTLSVYNMVIHFCDIFVHVDRNDSDTGVLIMEHDKNLMRKSLPHPFN